MGVAPEQIGNRPLFDVDADEEQLLALDSIWECPMINKFAGFDNNGKPFSGWTCGCCPLDNDGSQAKPFRTMNATKALIHVPCWDSHRV